MAITFEQFFQSIVAQESGGNYSAVGPPTRYGRAYGKYQVLASNIPSWTKQYYGQSLTPQQFLNNRAAQDAVARGKLKSYWDKYGARGAASAWYSGNPKLHMSTASQQGGPSIKKYVDSVINRAAGIKVSGGSGGGGGGSSPGVGGAELAEAYGFVESLFTSVPELKKLFQKATAGKWTAQKFQAELRDTSWWKTRPDSARKYLTLQAGDPATARQQLDQTIIKVTQLSASLGAITDYKTMRSVALQSIMNGWNDAQLRWELAKKVNLKGDNRAGESGEAYDKLASYGYEMGIGADDKWLDGAARRIVSGASSLQYEMNKIRHWSKGRFPTWAKQIDAGQTVADLASPYFQSMSRILELPAGSINLFDPTIVKALQFKDAAGKAAVKPMWQFENDLRSDARWKKTKNAQDQAMQVTRQVLSDFGFVY